MPSSSSVRRVAGAAAAAGALGYLAFRRARARQLDLKGKVVLITGGSRGLGLAMAREFGKHGAVLAICARDTAELELAQRDLSSRGVLSHRFVCDVSDSVQLTATLAQVARQLGPIDVLVNNAGIITVGPVLAMNPEDFEQAMKVMFWAPLHATLAVLPAMRERKQGSIVNITSIGGKVSVPHLLPYCCAKFALVALSEGLRQELAPLGIRVTTIAPGLLRTGSHLRAEFKGKPAREYAWFAAAAAMPLVSIGAERAARSIVCATIQGKAEKILSVPADFLARMQGLSPGLTGGLLSLANRMLPNGEGEGPVAGRDIENEFDSSLWKKYTHLIQGAANSLNE